jgi:hypothetical protein
LYEVLSIPHAHMTESMESISAFSSASASARSSFACSPILALFKGRVPQFTFHQYLRHIPRIVFLTQYALDRLDSVALRSLAIPYCSIQVSHSHEISHAHMAESTESTSASSLSLLRQLLDQILPFGSSPIDVLYVFESHCAEIVKRWIPS